MDETSKNLFPFSDPLSTSFGAYKARSGGILNLQPDLDPFLPRKGSIDFYDGALISDYLNNDDQMSNGNFNFDELPLREEKPSYVNSFLPNEIIGVYNNQLSDAEEKPDDQVLNHPEEPAPEDPFPFNPLNFNSDEEGYEPFLQKSEKSNNEKKVSFPKDQAKYFPMKQEPANLAFNPAQNVSKEPEFFEPSKTPQQFRIIYQPPPALTITNQTNNNIFNMQYYCNNNYQAPANPTPPTFDSFHEEPSEHDQGIKEEPLKANKTKKKTKKEPGEKLSKKIVKTENLAVKSPKKPKIQREEALKHKVLPPEMNLVPNAFPNPNLAINPAFRKEPVPPNNLIKTEQLKTSYNTPISNPYQNPNGPFQDPELIKRFYAQQYLQQAQSLSNYNQKSLNPQTHIPNSMATNPPQNGNPPPQGYYGQNNGYIPPQALYYAQKQREQQQNNNQFSNQFMHKASSLTEMSQSQQNLGFLGHQSDIASSEDAMSLSNNPNFLKNLKMVGNNMPGGNSNPNFINFGQVKRVFNGPGQGPIIKVETPNEVTIQKNILVMNTTNPINGNDFPVNVMEKKLMAAPSNYYPMSKRFNLPNGMVIECKYEGPPNITNPTNNGNNLNQNTQINNPNQSLMMQYQNNPKNFYPSNATNNQGYPENFNNMPFNPSQTGFNPNQSGFNPNQSGFNPNQSGFNPNQPGFNPNQSGFNPNQSGFNPNQPGFNPNQPGFNPNQQSGFNSNQQPGFNPNQQPGFNPNKQPGFNPKIPKKLPANFYPSTRNIDPTQLLAPTPETKSQIPSNNNNNNKPQMSRNQQPFFPNYMVPNYQQQSNDYPPSPILPQNSNSNHPNVNQLYPMYVAKHSQNPVHKMMDPSQFDNDPTSTYAQKQKPFMIPKPAHQPPNNSASYLMPFNPGKGKGPMDFFQKRGTVPLGVPKERDSQTDEKASFEKMMLSASSNGKPGDLPTGLHFLNLDSEHLMQLYRKNLSDLGQEKKMLLLHSQKKYLKSTKEKRKKPKQAKPSLESLAAGLHGGQSVNNSMENFQNFGNYKLEDSTKASLMSFSAMNNNNNNQTLAVKEKGLNCNNTEKNLPPQSIFPGEQQIIGKLTAEERKLRIEKYLKKKRKRTWNRKINYFCRKQVADKRLRLKGRFLKKS